jgi:hypothetical protein
MQDVESLKELMEAGFAALKEQRADDRSRQDQQHAENRQTLQRQDQTLQRIEMEVRKTNGRVTRTEGQIEALLRDDKGEAPSADSVTLDRLKWYLACTGGGFAAAIALLKLMGKL